MWRLSDRTKRDLRLDFRRLLVRALTRVRRRRVDLPSQIHLGSGSRRVPGWLNVDLSRSDLNLDLTAAPYPFPTGHFTAAVAQHVIEHLDMETEARVFLNEIRRILTPGGVLWLSTPDMRRIAEAYLGNRLNELVEGRMRRHPNYIPPDLPVSNFMNEMFHQRGEHLNLFDFDLLEVMLLAAGFTAVEPVEEQTLIDAHPEFPMRYDDDHTLYVRAV